MDHKIPRIDSRILEEWNRNNPKVGFDESKIIVKKVGKYGNYALRNKLMELISWLKDQYNVIVVQHDNVKYFKQLERRILNDAIEMVKML